MRTRHRATIFSPRTWERKAADYCEFKASLSCLLICDQVNVYNDTLSQIQKNLRQNQFRQKRNYGMKELVRIGHTFKFYTFEELGK